jgi:hypothetical protein
MTLSLELVRPDDLLSLRVDARNLRLDAADPAAPQLVVDDPGQPAYLVIHFPPQAIAEAAYFQSSPTPPPKNEPPVRNPGDPPPTPPVQPPPPAGSTPARIGGASRLVFLVPPDIAIPYNVAGMLDWGRLTPVVSPLTQPDAGFSRPPIGPPAPLETAIELPYRLLISPEPAAGWLHRSAPQTSRGRTELWHTQLVLRHDEVVERLSRLNPAALRAIWSPDYNPDSPPGFGTPDPDLGQVTALSPKDRHELVVLTSAFGGYVDESNRTYLPLPFYAEQLMLSPLGGYLKSRGGWNPPWRWIPFRIDRPFVLGGEQPAEQAEPPDAPPIQRLLGLGDRIDIGLPIGRVGDRVDPGPIIDIGGRVGDHVNPGPIIDIGDRAGAGPIGGIILGRRGRRLDVSEWVHSAAQGRDHYVRVVYEGNLYPFGHRAALVKVTERRFIDQDGAPVAFLIQRMYIVVRQPELDYRGQLPNDGRGMPLIRVRLTTLVTPDIAFPFNPPANIVGGSFWVMVGPPGKEQDFKFHAVGTDIAGQAVEFTASLIFVPFSDQPASYGTVFNKYSASGERRLCRVPGQKLRLAAPAGERDNTTFNAQGMRFSSESDAPAGFWQPKLHTADVLIPAVQQLLGQNQPTTLKLYPDYVLHDAGATNGVFAQVADANGNNQTLGVGFDAKQAGGIATPNMAVTALSQTIGPLAGQIGDAVANSFNPAQFFPAGSAQLFGVLDLAKLLAPVLDLAAGAPNITVAREGMNVVARLSWQPPIVDSDVTVGIVTFRKRGATQLTVTGEIVRPLDGAGGETSRFEGRLTSFVIDLLNVVAVNFDAFGFRNVSKEKPEVTVSLDPGKPVAFQGDLSFVEELRKLIPPGLFGDGPSLDLTPELVRAGFAIGLPPVAIGVFALKDVQLAAFLELPFKDGRPTFDFAVSERHHPFVLTVMFLGGGGFFHLQIDTKGVKQLEAALEFGACAALNLGVASGSVHMMAGIYFGMARNDANVMQATLTGYLRVGGELSVLGLISISIEFNLSFTYLPAPKDKAYGKATLSVTVEIAFFSKTVELTVEKSFGGSSGDPTFGDMLPEPDLWAEYAAAFA